MRPSKPGPMSGRALTLRDLLESLDCQPAESLVDVELGRRWGWGSSHERGRPQYIAVSATLDPEHGTEITIRITPTRPEEDTTMIAPRSHNSA